MQLFCPITNQLSLTLWMRNRSQISDLSPVPLFYTLQFFHCLIFPSVQFLNANLLIFIFKDMFPCWRKFVRRCVFSEYCEKILCKKISHPEFESTQQSRFLDFNAYKMRIKADEFYHSNILNLDMKVARNYLKLIFSVWTFCIVI